MARRGAGEGSIYRDKTNGGWRATVELGIGEDGQRERKYLRGRTRADVAQKVRDVLKDVDEGLPVSRDGDGPTVEQWLDHWHSTIQKKRLRESSYLAEGLTLQNHVIPVLGKVRLKMLQPEQVERLYARLDEKGLSPSTVLKAHRHLNRALKVAMQRGLVSRNVCSLVDAPSVTHTEVVPLTQEEARRLLDVAVARRNGARWSVALGLGLRQGEALGLAWPNVDLEAGTIRVSQALGKAHWEHGCSEDSRKPSCEAKRGFLCPERNGHGLRLALPKSRAGKRTVPLPAPVVEQLRAHRKAQLEERMAAGSEWWEEQKAGARLLMGPRLPHASRAAGGAPPGLVRVEVPSQGGGRPGRAAARRTAHGGVAAAGHGRAGPSRDGGARALADRTDPEHIQPRHAGGSTGRCGRDGRCLVGRGAARHAAQPAAEDTVKR